jgi:prolipoprotein diacylglyceryltransferase
MLAPPFSCSGDSCTATLDGGLTETIDRAGATLSDAGGKILEHGIGVHQTALYDMLLAGILFTFLWWFIRSPRREGVVTLTFALSYGCIRLLEDSLRIDKRFGPLTGSQWTALAVAIVASGFLIYWAISPRPGPTTPGRLEPSDAPEPVAAAND